jgi:hypothetical protein
MIFHMTLKIKTDRVVDISTQFPRLVNKFKCMLFYLILDSQISNLYFSDEKMEVFNRIIGHHIIA